MSNWTHAADDLIFFHLTDLHLSDRADALVNKRSPAAKIRALLERLHALEIQPAFLLITGDLVNNGQPAEYQYFQEWLTEFEAFGVPVLLGLGNHDARGPFRQILLNEPNSVQPYYYSQVIDGLNIIMLDSHLPGKANGYLDTAQLAWLDAELTKEMARGHLIALHHPPVPALVRQLDRIGLTNPDALAAVVRRHQQQVLGILSGHVHYSHVAQFAERLSVTTPSVAYIIDPGAPENLRLLDGSGFSIGTIRNNQLFMDTIMMPGTQEELDYQLITSPKLA